MIDSKDSNVPEASNTSDGVERDFIKMVDDAMKATTNHKVDKTIGKEQQRQHRKRSIPPRPVSPSSVNLGETRAKKTDHQSGVQEFFTNITNMNPNSNYINNSRVDSKDSNVPLASNTSDRVERDFIKMVDDAIKATTNNKVDKRIGKEQQRQQHQHRKQSTLPRAVSPTSVNLGGTRAKKTDHQSGVQDFFTNMTNMNPDSNDVNNSRVDSKDTNASLACNTTNAEGVERDFVINKEMGLATCIHCLEELDFGQNDIFMNSILSNHLQHQCSNVALPD